MLQEPELRLHELEKYKLISKMIPNTKVMIKLNKYSENEQLQEIKQKKSNKINPNYKKKK